ncbi:hypothetical protein IW140_004181 [Coemansia sp. RSA 1813]|nr:hypothetical protein EV178_002275 [Coemansia sp. RSA 1646]KAJ1765233.1 hypothetical protein LPJ74_006431 [Coemansia sp. RSA 1843]KAJ2090035.1 hypothetical protein IW138_003004 [Coemansia sp. RSA 986]KAJ2217005.1 hypothetical protein EV179_000772 [Coemansia sp. RSA 487]KAJ2568092.1 hypothetical protein IW140_004181 [Coemansia sp. RSA 1813]
MNRAQSPPQHTVLGAERDVLRRIGLLSDHISTTDSSSSDDETRAKSSSHPDKERQIWTRTTALLVTRGVIAFARYPVDTATMHAQLTGTEEYPMLSFVSHQTWHRFVAGFLYQWSSGKQLQLLAAIVSVVVPQSSAASFGVDVARIAVHYGAFAVLYGTIRQSVVARLLPPGHPVHGVVAPAVAWIRDVVCLRWPRGAVLSVYVRDVVGNYMSASLRTPMLHAFVSRGMFTMYVTMLKTAMTARRAVTDVVAGLGRITGTRRPTAGSDDIEVEFVSPGSVGQQHSGGRSSSGRRQGSMDKHAEQQADELLVYMRYISTVASGIVTRALLYPVDSVIVRLMADEAALTACAYTGFFDCLARVARSPRGLATLYAGFTRALVADVVLGWAAAELAHALCKTAWLKI